jgi:hypothetical protein
MRTRVISTGCYLVLLGVLGCDAARESTKTTAPAKHEPEYQLADWLEKPRQELAEHASEVQARVALQRRAVQEGRLHLGFLPKLPMPLIVPIWAEASFSAKRGIALPPYANENAADPQLALHLASFGDAAGARLLADASDTATQKAIDAAAYERNYPAEWTRLAALLLYDAELRLAQGETNGARDLLAYHWQIKKVLTAKAIQGWLGQALLPVGRLAFEQAIPSWQGDRSKDLVKDGQAFLTDSRDFPVELKFAFHVPFESLYRTFRKEKGSRAALAGDPRRALDLLSLPLPAGGVSSVVAFFDPQDRFSELLVLYRPGLADGYKNAEHLFRLLHDRGLESKGGQDSLGMTPRVYQVGKVRCEAAVMPRSNVLGGFVHLRPDDSVCAPYQLERTFGAASLDHSFEQNRLQLVPQERKTLVITRQPTALAKVTNPIPTLKLQQLGIERNPNQELTGALNFDYPAPESDAVPFQSVLLPLWSRSGFVPFMGVVDGGGGHFSFVWQDSRTSDELTVPFELSQPIRLRVADRTETSAISQHMKDTQGHDAAERRVRLAAGKPIQQIPRKLDQFFLGATREEILGRLPSGHTALKRDIPGGLMVTFPIESGNSAVYLLRQAFVRFDDKGRAVEIRVRYDDGPSRGKASWASELLKDLQKKCGAPQSAPNPWTAVWTDLPAQKPTPAAFSWTDDVSHLLYSRDAGGVELKLVDCPADLPAGVVLPPLEALAGGPEHCALGTTREQIFAGWNVKKPVMAADGALILRPAASTGLDALLVWFDRDKVVRIVGRHAQPAGKDNATLSEAIRADWSRGMRTLGWPRRQDMAPGNVLQGLAWHDDAKRIRIFWQEPDDGPARVFTEWKALPIH